MKVLNFYKRIINVYQEPIYILKIELAKEHYLIVKTYNDNYNCDLYFSDQPKYKYLKNTMYYFEPCKWGNNQGVKLNREYKASFNDYGMLTKSTYYISDAPEHIYCVMMKWAQWYVNKNYGKKI